MTKSTITRERAQQIFLGNGPELSASEERELARMALAAMDSESECLPLDYLQGHKDGLEWAAQLAEANHPETGDWLYDDPLELAKAIRKGPDMPPAQPAADSEPVAIIDQANLDYLRSGADADVWPPEREEMGDVLLYRHAQPAPVSYSDFEEFWSAYIHPLAQDDELKDFSWGIWNACVSNSQPAPVVPEEMPCGGAADDYHDGYQDGWNACRAAMLQAGTLNNEGTKQAWTGIPDIDNAINMLDRIDTLDSCDDDRIEAVKTVLRRLAGNSPVIPDGYVMVPKEMTDEIGEAIAMQANCCGGIALDIYDAMIAAAPHDTPALNSVQSVVHVSDGWIPVSERMPPSRHEVLVGRWWGEKPRWCCKWATYIPGHPDSQSSGWLIPGASWTPTHWMPLPVAPQEVKGD
ncbi:DUF551 domain-containing protein [Klebsiella pneumoniae]|uniref:DUF551 domain-containing protein n=2 Tax=Klebsiella/Raoultella group TaxID=2890311 RepID=UPI001F5BE075|nr:DUF551 domain-containing protein [Klebsiella pneumoniae]